MVYAGIFIAVCGIYPAFPQNVTWIANNLAGSYKRAAGMAVQVSCFSLAGGSRTRTGVSYLAMSCWTVVQILTRSSLQIGLGNLGGAFASNFYRAKDKPKFLLGHGLELGFVVLGMFAVLVLRFAYGRINAQREKSGKAHGLTDAELSDLGDKSPSFRYTI